MGFIIRSAAVLTGLGLLAGVAGTTGWNRASRQAIAGLESAPGSREATYQLSAIAAAPAPVAAYFRKVLKEGQPLVRSAVATQEADFFINGAWRRLTATQHFSTSPPGFVWDARIGMAPLLSASVRDAYVRGHGAMQASMFGLYSLADQMNKPELNAGALQRYLGEAVWFPTALLPSASVTWSERDEHSAVVTLRDQLSTVSLIYEYDDGLVTSITGDRYKESDGRYTLQTWHIRCDENETRDGMIIPRHCEVSWMVNGRLEPYWRGRITSITYRY